MTEVLIVGAGPTGLVLALWLTRLDVRVRIIDTTSEPGTTSRAVAVQARTLELYAQLGLAEEVVARGRKAVGANLWVGGKPVAHAVFGDLGAGISPYPFVLIFPQDEHERLLIERLANAGVVVERRTALVSFDMDADRVRARLRRPDGAEEACEAAYIVGCDGAHSTVRESLHIGFPGGTYEHLFYVADVQANGDAINGDVHVALDTNDFLVVFPLTAPGHARLIGTVRENAAAPDANLSWGDVSTRVLESMRIDVERVHWFSTYRVHHRVAARFSADRAFIVGDAAHIHSPVGGQGMNTGIGDAVNLAWKLAAVLHGKAPASLLDSYASERMAFARRLAATTDRAFTAATSSSTMARRVRLDLLPRVIPLLFALPPTRRFMFRTVSQTSVNYRGSALSQGRAGAVHGGDRLPWVEAVSNGMDNFVPLMTIDWQVHVYGEATAAIHATCEARSCPLHVYRWRPEMVRAGVRRDAVYLIRPDGYVALADPQASVETLTRYLDARGISLGS